MFVFYFHEARYVGDYCGKWKLTDDLVHFLNEVGSWKVCELRGDSFKFVNRFLVDSFQFVHFLLYEHFGSTRQMFALLKKFSDKEVSDFLCIDSHIAVTFFLV